MLRIEYLSEKVINFEKKNGLILVRNFIKIFSEYEIMKVKKLS